MLPCEIASKFTSYLVLDELSKLLGAMAPCSKVSEPIRVILGKGVRLIEKALLIGR
jgi:hypothetical protein